MAFSGGGEEERRGEEIWGVSCMGICFAGGSLFALPCIHLKSIIPSIPHSGRSSGRSQVVVVVVVVVLPLCHHLPHPVVGMLMSLWHGFPGEQNLHTGQGWQTSYLTPPAISIQSLPALQMAILIIGGGHCLILWKLVGQEFLKNEKCLPCFCLFMGV